MKTIQILIKRELEYVWCGLLQNINDRLKINGKVEKLFNTGENIPSKRLLDITSGTSNLVGQSL